MIIERVNVISVDIFKVRYENLNENSKKIRVLLEALEESEAEIAKLESKLRYVRIGTFAEVAEEFKIVRVCPECKSPNRVEDIDDSLDEIGKITYGCSFCVLPF